MFISDRNKVFCNKNQSTGFCMIETWVVHELTKNKKAQGQINRKRQFFNLRVPYFRTDVGRARYSWEVSGGVVTSPPSPPPPAGFFFFFNFNYSECSETKNIKKLKFE